MPYFLNSFTILQYTPLKTQDLTIPTQSAVFSATRRRWKGAVTKALFSRRIVPRSTDVSYASRIFIRCFCYHDLLTTLCSIQSHTSPTCMHIASTHEALSLAWIRGGLHTSPDNPCGFSVSLAASQPTRCHNSTCRSVTLWYLVSNTDSAPSTTSTLPCCKHACSGYSRMESPRRMKRCYLRSIEKLRRLRSQALAELTQQ